MRLGQSWHRVLESAPRPRKGWRPRGVSTRGRAKWDRETRFDRLGRANPVYVDHSKRHTGRVTPKPDGFDYESQRVSVAPGQRLIPVEQTYTVTQCLSCNSAPAVKGTVFCESCKPSTKYLKREGYNC